MPGDQAGLGLEDVDGGAGASEAVGEERLQLGLLPGLGPGVARLRVKPDEACG